MDAKGTPARLIELLESSENWLMERILAYAKEHRYTAFTSTLLEAWRISIEGLSSALREALRTRSQPMELTPEEDFRNDPAAEFGIKEAQLHRERGIPLSMFLGLLKYYRQVYVDLILNAELSRAETDSMNTMVDRFFDRVEIGFLMEWTGQGIDQAMLELQGRNRDLTNEKNRYLTLFESLKTPALLLDEEDRIGNLNWAAARLLGEESLPGATYYQAAKAEGQGSGMGPAPGSSQGPPQIGEPVQRRFPWLMDTLAVFKASQGPHMTVRKDVETAEGLSVLEVTLSKMPDVSGKFSGTVIIMEDVTFKTKVDREKESLIGELRAALKTVKTLKGLIPICSACKSVRDDQGFWEEIELYITTHSDAQLTHGICPECAKKLYGIEV